MRKNVNKKSNNRSKVVSALAMLLVSAVALSSASYAWFTMSKQVEVKGIQLTATAPDNVLIATEHDAHTTITPYKSIRDIKDERTNNIFRGGTTKTINAGDTLIPCSSVNGTKLYYTEEINDDGSDKTTNSKYYETTTSTKESTEADGLYYVDIPLYILTTGSENVSIAVDPKLSSVTAEGENSKIYQAVKFAVLKDEDGTLSNIGGTFQATDTMFGNPVSDVTGTTATYADDNNAAITLKQDATERGTDFLLYGTDHLTRKNQVSGNNGKTYEYTKVVVRVWIEGQNKNCITDNANQSFNVDLVFNTGK